MALKVQDVTGFVEGGIITLFVVHNKVRNRWVSADDVPRWQCLDRFNRCERRKTTAQIQECTAYRGLPPLIAGDIGVKLSVASCKGNRRGCSIPSLRKDIEDAIQAPG